MPSTIQCHTPSYVPNGREVAVFSTERGLVRVRLAGRVAPVNVGNFVELARAGFYDGLKFHGGVDRGAHQQRRPHDAHAHGPRGPQSRQEPLGRHGHGRTGLLCARGVWPTTPRTGTTTAP